MNCHFSIKFLDYVLLLTGGPSSSSEVYSPNGKCQYRLPAFPTGGYYDIGKYKCLTFFNFSLLSKKLQAKNVTLNFLREVKSFTNHYIKFKIVVILYGTIE